MAAKYCTLCGKLGDEGNLCKGCGTFLPFGAKVSKPGLNKQQWTAQYMRPIDLLHKNTPRQEEEKKEALPMPSGDVCTCEVTAFGMIYREGCPECPKPK